MPASVSRARPVAGLLTVAALLTACESESAPPPPLPSGEIQIDASSSTNFAYFTFDGGGQVIPVTDPRSSSAWDLAFRRFGIRLNGGVAGGKGVTGVNLANNATATAAEVLAFTPASQRAAFDAVGVAQIPADTAFRSEGLGPDFSSWFRFNPATNSLIANPASAWKLRRGGGAFAVFRVTNVVFGGASQTSAELQSIRLEVRQQAAGGALGPAASIDVALGGQTRAVDFGTGTVVTPAGCNWDVRVTVPGAIEVNAAPGCDRGTFPLDVAESFTGLTTAADAPQYGPFLALVSGPVPNSFDNPRGPFLYNLRNDQRLNPTFNIYLVRVGAAVYKFQVLDYYNAGGQSGFVTLRWARVR